MMSQISWKAYFEFIAIVLVIYYAAILLLLYRNNITNLLFLKFQPAASPENKTALFENAHGTTEPIKHLLDEIKSLIRQRSDDESPKEELLFALQRLLSSERFQLIDGLSTKERINDFISKECQRIRSIHLSEEDLRVLWTEIGWSTKASPPPPEEGLGEVKKII